MNGLPGQPYLRAVIVGTGRSGSKYIAKVLSACGVPCGHEQVWGFGEYKAGLVVDSSWLAVASLPLPLIVWHQVRNPEAQIRSRVLNPPTNASRYLNVRDAWLPDLPRDRAVAAARWYVMWNLACERHAARRWRVEDVDAELVAKLGSELGLTMHETDAPLHLDPTRAVEVRTNVNRHTDPAREWSLDDLPKGADRDAVLWMGERYGYW